MTDASQPGLTRKALLQRGAAALVGAGTVPALVGGLPAAVAKAATATAASTPKRGGTLTVGLITGGSAETVDPALAENTPDILRVFQLFDTLYTVSPDQKIIPGLAVSADPNSTATKWTFTLRSGVKWHDGKPFGADDVVYNFNAWSSPKNYANGLLSPIVDFKNVRKRGPLTVEVPLIRAVADFPSLFWTFNTCIIQNGASTQSLTTHPIGTGPFKFKSFTPGQQSVFTANSDYFVHGGPYIDTLVINSSFSDENSRLNALLSGAIDADMQMPYNLAATVKNSGSARLLVASNTPNFSGIAMRVDTGPCADVRVRQALRLLVDRGAFVKEVADGYGVVGNDLTCAGAQYFASSLKRDQDIPKAKSLLKAAGQRDLHLTLQTSAAAPDFVPQATLFQEQAKAAGVTIALQTIDPATYFTFTGGYTSRPFGQVTWYTIPTLPYFYLSALWTHASYPETHWGSPAHDKLLFDALGETNSAKAEEKWYEVQLAQFNEGGYLIPNTKDFVDGLGPRVHGLEPSRYAFLDGYHLLDAWVE